MDTTTAGTAGALAQQIAAVTGQIAAVNDRISNNAVITGGTLFIKDTTTGQLTTLPLQQLTIAESATVFNTMLTVLDARQSAWAATLAAM
jgi:hypothetical protein